MKTDDWDGDAFRADEALGYGTCPSCKGALQTPGGFACDSCSQKVCRNCIHAYRTHYICADCASLLSAKEKTQLKDAKDLTKPFRSFARRSWLWWAFLLLLIMPVALGMIYLFAANNRLEYAAGSALLMLLIIWFWDRWAQSRI